MTQTSLLSRLGVFCITVGTVGLAVATFLWTDLRRHPDPVFSRDELLSCYSNLRSIYFGFQLFAQAHGGRFQFNVSTNSGGTLELCARGSGGVDTNAVFHFRAISNDLVLPGALVCPNDALTKAAVDFDHLHPSNITYLLRSGTDLDHKSHVILLLCPVDGNVAYADGDIRCAAVEGPPPPTDLLPYFRHDKGPYRKGLAQAIISCAAACLLLAIGLGLILKAGKSFTA
ncbi:exported hypothetical protein [Verrucomicrobia bacterium]|nr:exported hypothetical protein [Verrucomicrobiota bacterium]